MSDRNLDMIAKQAAQQFDRLINLVLDVECLQLQGLTAGEGKQSACQFSPARCRLKGIMEHLLVLDFGEAAFQQFKIAHNDAEKIVEIVGQPPGHIADRLHLLRLLQLRFGVELLGQIAQNFRSADDLAIGGADRRDREHDRNRLPVLAEPDRLHLCHPVALPDFSHDEILFREPIRREQERDMAPHHLVRLVAEHVSRRGVPGRDQAIQILADDGIGRGLDDGRVIAVNLPEALAVGDILDNRPSAFLAIFSSNGRPIEIEVQARAILAHVLLFIGPKMSFAAHDLHHRALTIMIFRRRESPNVQGQEFFPLVAGQAAEGFVEVEVATIAQARQNDSNGNDIVEFAKLSIALLNFLKRRLFCRDVADRHQASDDGSGIVDNGRKIVTAAPALAGIPALQIILRLGPRLTAQGTRHGPFGNRNQLPRRRPHLNDGVEFGKGFGAFLFAGEFMEQAERLIEFDDMTELIRDQHGIAHHRQGAPNPSPPVEAARYLGCRRTRTDPTWGWLVIIGMRAGHAHHHSSRYDTSGTGDSSRARLPMVAINKLFIYHEMLFQGSAPQLGRV